MAIGNTLGNIGGGALAGAGAGSAFGPYGAAGGGLLGALLGALGKGGGGKKGGDLPGYDRSSTFNPGQQALFDQLSAMLGGSLGGGLDERISAPYKREFEEQTIPNLAEQFAGAGAGAQNSSGFQQALGAAGAGLSERLAGLGAQQEQSTINQILQLLGISTESLMPEQTPWWQSFLGGVAPAVGQGLGKGLAGNMGNWFGGRGTQQGSSFDPTSGKITGKIFS